jgi:predicted nucleic acid-binding protein
VSLYLDTSCLVKLVRSEPESAEVARVAQGEAEVVISPLAMLELELLVEAGRLAGSLSNARANKIRLELAMLLAQPPFVLRPAQADVVAIAIRQAKSGAYCRTLDRLHLATMEALGIKRLLTNDNQQATAARALGFGVVLPR